MGKAKYLFLAIFGLSLLILGTQKVQAAEVPTQDVIINELMWMGSFANSKDEWIELRNMTGTNIDLSGWQIENAGPNKSQLIIPSEGTHIIPANGYYLLSRYSIADNILEPKKTRLNVIVDWRIQDMANISLSNSDNGNLVLRDLTGGLIDSAKGDVWPAGDNDKKYSMERNLDPGNGLENENWHTAIKSEGFVLGATEKGTPSFENSLIVNSYPTTPILTSPPDNTNLFTGQEVEFSWLSSIDPEGQGITYDFYLSCSDKFIDNKLVDSVIPDTNYFLEIDNIIEDYGICSKYYWKIIASDGVLETESGTTFSFTISEPTYSNAIIINELYPDPETGEEWIELYNNSLEDVNLKNWTLKDLEGSTCEYKISQDIIVPAFGYVVISKTQSSITLNNDQDGVGLIRPDKVALYETPIFSDGQKGWSFARNTAGTWQWTTKITPAAQNIISIPVVEETVDAEEEDVPKNITPIEVKTSEVQNYENYSVKITGTVVSTSGNTFYLDDGSGKAKVYIQAATGIEKPEMHTGDIFEVTGLVNLYRDVWRILPQKQDDIKLIKAKNETESESVASSAKKTTAKASTASTVKKVVTTAKARAPTNAKIASVSTNNLGSSTQFGGYKASFWIEMVKVLIGLAFIFLIILIIKLWRIKNDHPSVGGSFGDDLT